MNRDALFICDGFVHGSVMKDTESSLANVIPQRVAEGHLSRRASSSQMYCRLTS